MEMRYRSGSISETTSGGTSRHSGDGSQMPIASPSAGRSQAMDCADAEWLMAPTLESPARMTNTRANIESRRSFIAFKWSIGRAVPQRQTRPPDLGWYARLPRGPLRRRLRKGIQWSVQYFSHRAGQQFWREGLLEKSAGAMFMSGQNTNIIGEAGHKENAKVRLDGHQVLGQFPSAHAG